MGYLNISYKREKRSWLWIIPVLKEAQEETGGANVKTSSTKGLSLMH